VARSAFGAVDGLTLRSRAAGLRQAGAIWANVDVYEGDLRGGGGLSEAETAISGDSGSRLLRPGLWRELQGQAARDQQRHPDQPADGG
jgi:hypothetical protein